MEIRSLQVAIVGVVFGVEGKEIIEVPFPTYRQYLTLHHLPRQGMLEFF